MPRCPVIIPLNVTQSRVFAVRSPANGTPNKATVAKAAALEAASANPNITPLEFLLGKLSQWLTRLLRLPARDKREWHLAIETLLDIMGQDKLLQGNPLLERSVRHRFPYLDPLNHVQVELLKEHRAQNPDVQVLRGIQLTINGISAGLRNTG